MCIEVKKKCQCGSRQVQFHLRDNIMSAGVLDRLYCPECSTQASINSETMLRDKEWIIEYDMTLARMYGSTRLSLAAEQISPEFIFDHGYATWREMYPGESEDIAGERERIIARKDEDPKRYLQEISSWAINRINRLKEAGWRKAMLA